MKFMSGGIVSAVLMLGIASAANAQGTPVEKSGNTFHRAACGVAPAGFARCHAHIVTDAAGNAIANAQPPISGYTPADLVSAYNITSSGSSTTIIAAVDAFGYNDAEANLGVYRAQWGLPACTTANGCFKKLNQNGQQGSYPTQDLGWAQESALDIDMLSAMCPNCQIWLVEANSNSYSNLATAVNTAASLGAHAISNSYGGGEGGTQAYEPSYNHATIAVTASTGDNGYAAGPQFPATSPHVIAVGGTHLVHDGSKRGWAETVWAGAGSGCSTVYSKPAWQHDTGCTKRMEADVSAVADPATGVAVYGPTSGGNAWLKFGGTSVSAPIIGGIYGVNGKNVKSYAKTLYKKASHLYDVTSGSNGSCGGSYKCTGMPGYDGPTGLGTPNGSKIFH
jgi:subtilase family serine protease